MNNSHKLPDSEELALMVMRVHTSRTIKRQFKGDNECCGSQLSTLMAKYAFGKKKHKRSVFYTITKLHKKQHLIQESNRDTEHESHINGFGRRRFFVLTAEGERKADLLWEIYGHLYGPDTPPVFE